MTDKVPSLGIQFTSTIPNIGRQEGSGSTVDRTDTVAQKGLTLVAINQSKKQGVDFHAVPTPKIPATNPLNNVPNPHPNPAPAAQPPQIPFSFPKTPLHDPTTGLPPVTDPVEELVQKAFPKTPTTDPGASATQRANETGKNTLQLPNIPTDDPAAQPQPGSSSNDAESDDEVPLVRKKPPFAPPVDGADNAQPPVAPNNHLPAAQPPAQPAPVNSAQPPVAPPNNQPVVGANPNPPPALATTHPDKYQLRLRTDATGQNYYVLPVDIMARNKTTGKSEKVKINFRFDEADLHPQNEHYCKAKFSAIRAIMKYYKTEKFASKKEIKKLLLSNPITFIYSTLDGDYIRGGAPEPVVQLRFAHKDIDNGKPFYLGIKGDFYQTTDNLEEDINFNKRIFRFKTRDLSRHEHAKTGKSPNITRWSHYDSIIKKFRVQANNLGQGNQNNPNLGNNDISGNGGGATSTAGGRSRSNLGGNDVNGTARGVGKNSNQPKPLNELNQDYINDPSFKTASEISEELVGNYQYYKDEGSGEEAFSLYSTMQQKRQELALAYLEDQSRAGYPADDSDVQKIDRLKRRIDCYCAADQLSQTYPSLDFSSKKQSLLEELEYFNELPEFLLKHFEEGVAEDIINDYYTYLSGLEKDLPEELQKLVNKLLTSFAITSY